MAGAKKLVHEHWGFLGAGCRKLTHLPREHTCVHEQAQLDQARRRGQGERAQKTVQLYVNVLAENTK
eukprot:GDKH01018056.1.p4 GENE.GDKH01018056.1~~GDKH01018056.1.p4  ORF type:complete len:67 (+),score=9.59 GDKH01018056.1:37-237(+)